MPMAYENLPFNGDTCLEESFLRLKEKYNIEKAVETGTYHGDTTKWLAQNFKKVFTCEIAKQYFDIAEKNLEGFDNIDMYPYSSVDALPHILKQCDDKTIFFLDAHWDDFNPLHTELKSIEDAKLRPIIVVHDFFVPDKSDSNNPQGDFGFDVYPKNYPPIMYHWPWIESRVERIYGKGLFTKYYNTEVAENSAKRGCLFLEPLAPMQP